MQQVLTFQPNSDILATISSKGQITLPASVRKQLGVKKHDKVAFRISLQGNVVLTTPKYSSIADLAGAAGKLPKPLSWKKMRDIAHEERIEAKYTKNA